MECEILFRGKRLDNAEWMKGFYAQSGDRTFIIFDNDFAVGYVSMKEIIPATAGRYTGLMDKHGQRIFEGDIVECWSEGVKAKGTVQQRKDGLWIIYPAWQKTVMWGLCPDEYSHTTVEIIGNIHDTPELVEVQTDAHV